MTRPQMILDTETTSLAANYETGSGVIWELAVIERGSGAQHLWRMKPDLALADPASLTVGRYYERTSKMCTRCRPDRARDLTNRLEAEEPEWSDPEALAADVARLLADVTLIAANPAFDAGFLAAFLRRYGQAPAWHYRLRDIGSIAYGYLYGADFPGYKVPPIDASTDELARGLNVDPDDFERHSALGDCLLLAAMLDAIEGGTS
jgi:hypothetical protein